MESNNPLYGIYAAVTRSDHQGEPPKGWYPGHRMTIKEAIKGFTIWAAYGAFREHVLGSVEKGKPADFTILDQDITTSVPDLLFILRFLGFLLGGDRAKRFKFRKNMT